MKLTGQVISCCWLVSFVQAEHYLVETEDEENYLIETEDEENTAVKEEVEKKVSQMSKPKQNKYQQVAGKGQEEGVGLMYQQDGLEGETFQVGHLDKYRQSILKAHNKYRKQHKAPPLQLDSKVTIIFF